RSDDHDDLLAAVHICLHPRVSDCVPEFRPSAMEALYATCTVFPTRLWCVLADYFARTGCRDETSLPLSHQDQSPDLVSVVGADYHEIDPAGVISGVPG